MIIVRRINDLVYLCQDIGCDDFERAEKNRDIIKNRMFTTAYEYFERLLKSTPRGHAFPKTIPLGQLPQVDQSDWQENSGDDTGLTILESNLSGGDLIVSVCDVI